MIAPETPAAPGTPSDLIGPPESDSPIVAVPMGNAVIIVDRMTYEYQNGLARGADPSQAELSAALARADRVRVLAGGMLREEPLGTEVLLDTSRRAEVESARGLFEVVEDPEQFSHCHCLGGPTFEFFAGKERVAALAVHHGRSVRWPRWKHDAPLRDPGRVVAWLREHRIEEGRGAESADPLSMRLLSLSVADRHALRADSHRRRGEFRQAIEECGRAFEADPRSPLAFGVRGLTRRETGRHADAEADCSEAIRLGLENPEVYLARAVARDEQGRHTEALADCDRALALDPKHPAAYNSRAVIRARTGRLIEALADYGKAIELAPDWPMPAGNRGSLQMATGRFREAAADFTEAIRRFEAAREKRAPWGAWSGGDVTIAAYHCARGEAFAALGEDDDALADFNRAVDLGPDDPRAHLARGRFLFRQGEADAAMSDFDEAIRLRPDLREGYLERGQARAALQDFEEALADVTEAVRWSPDDPACYFLRGQLLGQLGRIGRALRDFDRVIDLAPENPQGFLLRASCWSRLGRFDRKRDDLESAVRLAPEWPLALNSLAWHLATCPDASQRQGPRAVEIARQAVEHAPIPEPEYLDTLAAALAESGDFGRACDVAREAIELIEDPGRRSTYEDRLALYEDGRPYHDPPPGDGEPEDVP